MSMSEKHLRGFVYVSFVVLILASAGCRKEKGPESPSPTVFRISVDSLTRGDTTTLFGDNFGRARGIVKIGDAPARIISWSNSLIRISVPNVKDGTYPVEIELPTGEIFQRGTIAVRGEMSDGLYDWIPAPIDSIDGSSMEPLVIMFAPVASSFGERFDYNAPIPKNREELLNELAWACEQGVQMARLFFPAELTSSNDDYADLSMRNIRSIISETVKNCPGMMIDVNDLDLPLSKRLLIRSDPAVSVASPYGYGDFKTTLSSGEVVSGMNNYEAMNAALARTEGYYVKPLPVVMTPWQALSLPRLINAGAALQKPRVFQLYMAYDDRAQDDLKSIELSKTNLAAANPRYFNVVTTKNVARVVGYSVTSGDHIVFGFNYSRFWPGESDNYISNNMYVLEKILEVADRIGRPIATIEQAEKIIGRMKPPSAQTAKISVSPLSGTGRDVLPAGAVKSAARSADGSELWVAAGGVFLSQDGGAKFKLVRVPYGVVPNHVAATDNGAIWIGSTSEGLMKTADRGANFNRYTVASGILDGNLIGCLHTSGNAVFACMNSSEAGNIGKGIVYSPDGGNEWYVITESEGLPTNEISAIFAEDNWIFAGIGTYSGDTGVGGLLFSGDTGVTWTRVQGIDSNVTAIHPWHDNTLMVGTRNGLFTVEYGGARAAKAKSFPENARVTSMRMDNRGWLWIGASDGVYITDDKGANFRKIASSDGLPSDVVRSAVLAGSNAVIVATDAGLSKIVVSR